MIFGTFWNLESSLNLPETLEKFSSMGVPEHLERLPSLLVKFLELLGTFSLVRFLNFLKYSMTN